MQSEVMSAGQIGKIVKEFRDMLPVFEDWIGRLRWCQPSEPDHSKNSTWKSPKSTKTPVLRSRGAT